MVRVSTDVAEQPQMAQTPVKKRKAEENRGQLTRGEKKIIRAQAGQALYKAAEDREGLYSWSVNFNMKPSNR